MIHIDGVSIENPYDVFLGILLIASEHWFKWWFGALRYWAIS